MGYTPQNDGKYKARGRRQGLFWEAPCFLVVKIIVDIDQ